jgi:hypothetical protein
MSGYLHTLAAQALGRATAIRPPRRAWSWRGFADPPATAVEQRDDPAIAATAPATDRAPPPVVPADVAQPVMKERSRAEPDESDASDAPARAVPNARPQPPQRKDAVPLLSENAVPPARVEIAASASPVQAMQASPLQASAEQHGRAQARAATPIVTRPAATATAVANANAAAIRPSPSPLREGSRPPVEAARLPDVHIHIGRIELAAVAPPPRREPAAAAKPTSLDDYLRRSSRKRS